VALAEDRYFVLVVQHVDGPCTHVVPDVRPGQSCGARLLNVAGPFPSLRRALDAQRYLAQEWVCARPRPDRDGFVKQYWGGWPWASGTSI
jgi:hypothetical protein